MKVGTVLIVALASAAVAFGLPQGKQSRVVGGEIAQDGQFPSLIAIREVADRCLTHYCAGTLLSDRWILTAGQCCLDPNLFYYIVAGDYDCYKEDTHEQHVRLRRKVLHEDYNSIFQLSHDICVMEVDEPLNISSIFVQPATLPDPSLILDDSSMVTMVGWGAITEGGALAEYVHYVDMPAITDAACNATYGGAPPVFDHNVCTGNLEEGGVGACSGDLGGPLYLKDTNTVVGVMSRSPGCARPTYPTISTEVSWFVDWIKANTGIP